MALPAAPSGGFRDCTHAITAVPNASTIIQKARIRALEYVGAAIRQLSSAPAVGTVYQVALSRHFVSPNAAQRSVIRTRYMQIRACLRNNKNFICNSKKYDPGKTTYALWLSADDLIHIYPQFFASYMGRTQQAMVLVHEAAHDIGIDAAAGPHAPNRGDPGYPLGNVAPPLGQTVARRMNNAEAYAMFAAHIWRSTDTGRYF